MGSSGGPATPNLRLGPRHPTGDPFRPTLHRVVAVSRRRRIGGSWCAELGLEVIVDSRHNLDASRHDGATLIPETRPARPSSHARPAHRDRMVLGPGPSPELGREHSFRKTRPSGPCGEEE